MDKFTMIRIVDSSEEDYSLLSDLHEKGSYNEIAEYLKQWDHGEYYEESEPQLALYDYTLYSDNKYLLVYNLSIGGTFALFAKINS